MFSQSIDLETIRNIIEVATVKNPRDIEGNTPLHFDGKTRLDMALESNHAIVVKFLTNNKII